MQDNPGAIKDFNSSCEGRKENNNIASGSYNLKNKIWLDLHRVIRIHRVEKDNKFTRHHHRLHRRRHHHLQESWLFH
jgi:hypothetical protein